MGDVAIGRLRPLKTDFFGLKVRKNVGGLFFLDVDSEDELNGFYLAGSLAVLIKILVVQEKGGLGELQTTETILKKRSIRIFALAA